VVCTAATSPSDVLDAECRKLLDLLVGGVWGGVLEVHGEPEQRSHEGYEWMYVLDGRLRLLLGDHELVLTPGEVAEFDTHTPHAFTNPADTPTELLILISAQGQRAHARARPARSAPNPTGGA
jgi:oxalate decarboxylase/phosphoglucose isomerase-like protein (cupin superfamily)